MIGQKYLRDVLLTTTAGSFSDLKISFDVEKTVSGEPNEASIRIWNLNDSSRNTINEELTLITLEAGYLFEGSRGVIFTGFVRDVTHERIDTDIVTTIEAGDGDKAARRSYIAKTYAAGTAILDVIKAIQSEMDDVALGEVILPEGIGDLKRSLSFMAPPQRCLNELGRTYGFYWSIQNGALEIIPGDGFMSDTVDITPTTGLIGVPSITDSGIIIRSLMNAQIRPGRKINVQSGTTSRAGQDGEYRVSSVAYFGDNRDGDFACEIEAELINDGKTVKK